MAEGLLSVSRLSVWPRLLRHGSRRAAGLFVVSTALVFAGAVAKAQSPADKAQEAIGIYASVMAVSSTCVFELGRGNHDALDAVLKALAAKAGFGEREVESVLKDGLERVGARKGEICRMDAAAFEGFAAQQFALAGEAAISAGLPQGTLPTPPSSAASAPPVPPAPAVLTPPGLVPDGMLPAASDAAGEQARQMLVAAHLAEAVSDECEIDLTDEETSALEKAQAYFRGRTGATEAQVSALTDLLEAKVEKGRRDFCAPAFGFRALLKSVMDAAR